MIALLTLYEAVRVPLVEDRLEQARAAAQQLEDAGDASAPVIAAASRVGDAADLAAARIAFAELSRDVVLELGEAGGADLKVFRCPMVATYPFWLQTTSGIANPYMGTSMPACGEGTSFKTALKAAQKSAGGGG
jgi:hypothetical protein